MGQWGVVLVLLITVLTDFAILPPGYPPDQGTASIQCYSLLCISSQCRWKGMSHDHDGKSHEQIM